MTDIINVPLNKLTVWTGNVRKMQNRDGIDVLAASIKTHGLQQNLVVAGGIRSTLPSRKPVTTELSLAENVLREDMRPGSHYAASNSSLELCQLDIDQLDRLVEEIVRESGRLKEWDHELRAAARNRFRRGGFLLTRDILAVSRAVQRPARARLLQAEPHGAWPLFWPKGLSVFPTCPLYSNSFIAC
jgi:hypothetical protein